MTYPQRGIALHALANLSQMEPNALSAVLALPYPSQTGFSLGDVCLDGPDNGGNFSYGDALAIEIARQLSDYCGLALPEALRVVFYTDAVGGYRNYGVAHVAKALTDFWAAIVGARNTLKTKGVRGSIEITGFGEEEFWSTSHFHGSFDQIVSGIKDMMTQDGFEYPDTDFSRVFMANVSAADRRLRQRARDLGIPV
jgi:hypothetical protein